MGYGLVYMLGVLAGGVAIFGIFAVKRRSLNAHAQQLVDREGQLETRLQAIVDRETSITSRLAAIETEFRLKSEQLEQEQIRQQSVFEQGTNDVDKLRQAAKAAIDLEYESLKARIAEFETRLITYDELKNENKILKHDLQNIDVNIRKLELDVQVQREEQARLDERCRELGQKYLNESEKWVGGSLSANNSS